MWTGGDVLTAIAGAEPYGCVTERDVVKLTRLPRQEVAAACARFVKGGLMRKTDKGCHQLTAAGRAAAQDEQKAALKQTRSELFQRVWHALRNSDRSSLSVPDLIERVARGGERHIESRIRHYLTALGRAGYVTQMPVRAPGHGHARTGYVRWKLINDTGPLAPLWHRGRTVADTIYDPNTREEKTLAAEFHRSPRRAPGREVAR